MKSYEEATQEEKFLRRELDLVFDRWKADPYVVYNPFNKPFVELPYIIGFTNGKTPEGKLIGYTISEDAYILKEVEVEEESWFWIDLGLTKNYSEKIHHEYRKHYPNGYKTIFLMEKEKIGKKYLFLLLEQRQQRIETQKNEKVASVFKTSLSGL